MKRAFLKFANRHPLALRRIVILLCCAGAVGGLGCATMLASDAAGRRNRAYFRKAILTDSIFALARPDAKLTEKLSTTNAIALLGKKHTYLLVEGGDTLIRVASQLDPDRLELDNGAARLFVKGKTVWGTARLRYAVSKDPVKAAEEEPTLLALGFPARNARTRYLSLPVKGMLCPPADLNTTLPSEFTRDRKIAFARPPNSMRPPDLITIITVPLAVATDVILTPVYLLGFVVVIISM